MISYKVLIALTVTNIICCGCDEGEKMKLYDCNSILFNVGFSLMSGLVDYCFVKQFLLNEVLNENTQLNVMDAESKYELMNDNEKDTIINASFEKFKEFAKDQYKVQELHEIVKEFFKYNANITADSRLKTPKEFCSDLTKLSIQECVDQKLKTEDEKNNMTEIEKAEILITEDAELLKTEDECIAEILKTEDAEILKTEDAEILKTEDDQKLKTEDDQKLKTEDEKNNVTEIEKGQILRIDDGFRHRVNYVKKIEYGEDKYKNLIKTNILNSKTYYKKIRDYIENKLPDFKKKYYEYQIKVIKEMTSVFQDHRKWCAETKGFKDP